MITLKMNRQRFNCHYYQVTCSNSVHWLKVQ